MTRAAQGDVVNLAAAGTANAGQAWRGGAGLLMIDTFNAGGNFEVQTPGGAWIGVRDINTGAAITSAANGAFNFILPACRIRMSAAGGTMNVNAVGI